MFLVFHKYYEDGERYAIKTDRIDKIWEMIDKHDPNKYFTGLGLKNGGIVYVKELFDEVIERINKP